MYLDMRFAFISDLKCLTDLADLIFLSSLFQFPGPSVLIAKFVFCLSYFIILSISCGIPVFIILFNKIVVKSFR